MALSHARIPSSTTSVRTSARGPRGRRTAATAGRSQSTAQVHVVRTGAVVRPLPRSGCNGVGRASVSGAGSVDGGSTGIRASIAGRIPVWASATTAPPHRVRTSRIPYESDAVTARDDCRRFGNARTGLTLDHQTLTCQMKADRLSTSAIAVSRRSTRDRTASYSRRAPRLAWHVSLARERRPRDVMVPGFKLASAASAASVRVRCVISLSCVR
jgi:hypothetical protein